ATSRPTTRPEPPAPRRRRLPSGRRRRRLRPGCPEPACAEETGGIVHPMRKSLAALATVTLLSLSSACGGSADDATPAAATASAGSKSDVAATSSTGLTRDNFVERLSAAQKDAGS